MSILAGYVLGLRTCSNYTSGEVLELIHWHPLFFRKMQKKDVKGGVVTGYFKQQKEIDVRHPDVSVRDAVLISEGDIRLIADDALDINNSLICSQGSVYLSGKEAGISGSNVAYGGDQTGWNTGTLHIQGRGSVSESVFEKWPKVYFDKKTIWGLDFSKKFIEMLDARFRYCAEIEFKCDDIDNITMRGCEFASDGFGPIIKMSSDSSIHTPSKCMVVIENTTFGCLGNEGVDGVAMQLKEASIEKKDFVDSVEINVSSTNVRREISVESSMFEAVRKLDQKFKCDDYSLKWKESNFVIVGNINNVLVQGLLINSACVFPIPSEVKRKRNDA